MINISDLFKQLEVSLTRVVQENDELKEKMTSIQTTLAKLDDFPRVLGEVQRRGPGRPKKANGQKVEAKGKSKPTRGRRSKLGDKLDEFIKDYQAGKSNDEIAKKYKITTPTIYGTLRRMGISTRREAKA